MRVYRPYAPPTERGIRQGHFGTLFIGTPHPTYSRRNAWHKLILILHKLKLSRLQRSQAELESTIVANISQQFERSVIDTHVASIYETQVTKVSSGLFDSEKFVVSIHLSLTSYCSCKGPFRNILLMLTNHSLWTGLWLRPVCLTRS